jgi:hypothetical protein
LRVASGELRPLTALRNRTFCYHEIDGAVYSARRVGNLPSPLLAENRSPTAGGVTHPIGSPTSGAELMETVTPPVPVVSRFRDEELG